MKLFLKLLTLSLAVCLAALLFAGCFDAENPSGGTDVPSVGENESGESGGSGETAGGDGSGDTAGGDSGSDTVPGDGEGDGQVTPPKRYTITFNVNGTITEVKTKEGAIPVFRGSTDKPATMSGYYTFIGWDKELAPATEDTTYTAKYTYTKQVKYSVSFVREDGRVTSNELVNEGEIPVPPTVRPYNTNTETFTFLKWSIPIEPVTKEFFEKYKQGESLVYTAEYTSAERLYTVNFAVNGKIVHTGYFPYNTLPVYGGEKIEIPKGYSYIGWQGLSSPITEDNKTVELMFTCNDPYQLEWALGAEKLSFSSSATSNDNGGDVLTESSAVLYMALEVHSAPDLTYASRYRDRAVESLKYMVSDKGNAPHFDLQPYWCYATLTAAISVCRETPAIWDMLTEEEQEKYDIIMRSFAYILTFGTADGNNYSTGPGLTGNFGKGWNPNYRLANVIPMLFVGKYFGGAANVNAILHAFDYDNAVADFEKYPCFSRAYKRWTTKIADTDGNPVINPATGAAYPDASYFLENGGPAYIFTEDSRLGYSGVTSGGSGKGVRVDYKYNGFTLDQVDKIMASLLNYTYSGGVVFSSTAFLGSDGIYPQTALKPILAGTPKAYILDGTVSPVEGLQGLMLEFNSGDGGNKVGNDNTSKYNGKNIRSSASYNIHNFIMVASAVSALESLGAYDCDSAVNASVYKLMWVGNTDLIYKLEHGYMSYSLGSGYETHEKDGGGAYLAWKAWWNNVYSANNPYEDKTEEENPPESIPEDAVIFFEDYSESSVNANYDKSDSKNGVSYGAGGKFGASFTTESDGTNTYLSIRSSGLKNWSGDGTAPMTDLLANLDPEGGLRGALGTSTAVVFSMDLAKSSLPVLSGALRLRAVSSADTVELISVDASGNVSIPDKSGKVTLGRLSEKFTTVTVSVDFATGTVVGQLGEGSVKTTALPIPAASSAKTALEWLKTLNIYVFNWYFNSNNTETEKELLADNIMIYTE